MQLAAILDVLGLAGRAFDAARLHELNAHADPQHALKLLGDRSAEAGHFLERVMPSMLDRTSSTWLGKTLVPRMMSMSSLRERTFCMRACVRPHAQGSVTTRVRSWVR